VNEGLRELFAVLGFEVDEAGFKNAEKRLAEVLGALQDVDAAARKAAKGVAAASGAAGKGGAQNLSGILGKVSDIDKAMAGPLKAFVKAMGVSESQLEETLKEFSEGIKDGAKAAAKEIAAARAEMASKPDLPPLLRKLQRDDPKNFGQHDEILQEARKLQKNPLWSKVFARQPVSEADSQAQAMAKGFAQQDAANARKRAAAKASGGGKSKKQSAGLGWGDWMELGNGLNALGGQGKGFFEYAIHQASELETAMSKVASKMDNVSKADFARMKAAATQLGMEFGYTAAQAAEGMEALAASGLTVDDAIKQLTPTLQFAQAAELGVDRAAELAMETMHQFGLQTNDFTMIGDILVKAANASTISVSDMAESLKYVGPNAHAAGVSLETTAVMIAALGNAGIKGSMAGTTLRAMFGRLAKQTPAATKALARVGITAKDMAKGVTDPIGLLTKLAKAMENLDEAQRGELLSTAFGTEASAGLTSLLDKITQNAKEGKQGFGELTDSIHNYKGAMKSASDILGNTTEKRLEKLKNTMAATAAILGEQLLPYVEQVTDAAKGAIEAYQAWADENPKLNDGLIKVAAGLTALTVAGGTLVSIWRTLRPLLELFGIGGAVEAAAGAGAATGAGTAAAGVAGTAAAVGAAETVAAGTAATVGAEVAGGAAVVGGGAAAAGGVGAALMAALPAIATVAAVVLAGYGLKKGVQAFTGDDSWSWSDLINEAVWGVKKPQASTAEGDDKPKIQEETQGFLERVFGDKPISWSDLFNEGMWGSSAGSRADALFARDMDPQQRAGERNAAFQARMRRLFPQDGQDDATYTGRIGRLTNRYRRKDADGNPIDEAAQDATRRAEGAKRFQLDVGSGMRDLHDAIFPTNFAYNPEAIAAATQQQGLLRQNTLSQPSSSGLLPDMDAWRRSNLMLEQPKFGWSFPTSAAPAPGASAALSVPVPPPPAPNGPVDSHDTISVTIHTKADAREVEQRMQQLLREHERNKQRRTQANITGQ